MAEEYILELQNIKKQFSGVEVLHGLHLAVKRGTIHSLVGENGAGKSTLMKILSGYYPFGEYTGDLLLEGRSAQFATIAEAEEAGIEIISQELELVKQMTVYENIFLGKEIMSHHRVDVQKMICRSREIFDRFGLEINPCTLVEDLGVGQQQMVAIAKALSGNGKILIFDEPTAALTEAESNKLMEIINELKRKGITCIYISHRLGEVMALSDTITVIRDGSTILTNAKTEFSEDLLIKHMVGRTMENRFPHRDAQIGGVVLKISDMTAVNNLGKKVVDHVSLEARAGEILGISGLMGAGRTELALSIFGAFPGESRGTVEINGQAIQIRSPKDAIKNGIGLVVEDRKCDGLVLCLDVIGNISMASLDQISPRGIVDENAEIQRVQEMVQQLAIKASRLTMPVERLSGGNQQKVSVSKMLLTKPKVLILDEPTRGVDVGAKYEIYTIINALAKAGVAVIMISSELPEILGMSDRILVMKGGKITAEIDGREATQENVMYYSTLEER